ncbi:hypothetical protein [Prosthecochloris sp. CIB 2401]|uniref:hypothetical protein n=1 Tax=Prosthecochloris sp. CIB 2401 TaxID=1868325 RepID=UPI00080AB674|nr:hypothetical protein [Prosthecochloris sp. CIB 2401]ANT64381.1 hypothetical protein Ptc2401_00582 [Prosthecochloris sp. CIB 2401]
MTQHSTPGNRHPLASLHKCNCGKYHLNYRYIRLTMMKSTLLSLMEECYEWDDKRRRDAGNYRITPFVVMLGFVSVAVAPEDFDEFNEAVQQGAREALHIDELVQQFRTS